MSLDSNWQKHLEEFTLAIEKLKWNTGSTKLHMYLN